MLTANGGVTGRWRPKRPAKKTCWRCGREYRHEVHKMFKGKMTPTCPMCGATIRIKPRRLD